MSESVIKEKKKIHYRKWVCLAVSLLISAFIIVQAFLPASQSARWSNIFVRFFTNLFNGSGVDTTETIKVENLNLNYDEDYKFNYVEGYIDKEIVLGTSKRLNAAIAPTNASNSAVTFSTSDDSIVKLTQNLNYVYVTGLKVGSVDITATSLADKTITSTYSFEVIEAKAPTNYVVQDIAVYEGSYFYLPISYENPAYYDVNKLTINNSNPSLVNESEKYQGLYYASSVGEDAFTVNDKSFNVSILDSTEVIYPHFTSIEGKDVIYSSSSAEYRVVSSNEPTSNEVLWQLSSNDVAKVNKDGKLIVDVVKEETKVTLYARSLLDDTIIISKEITLKPVTITSFELVIPFYGNHITNMPYMGETGEEIKVWLEDNTGTIGVSGVTVTSSHPEVAEVYAQGSYIYINCIKEGDTKIVVTSKNNPNVSKYVDLQVVVRGIINRDNYLSFSGFVRKSIGHFLLFLINGVFTFLFLYELNKDVNYKGKKKWHYIALALILGVFLAGLSEFIQYFIPGRAGSLVDVATDSTGFIIGVLITLLVIYLIHRHKNKKIEKKEVEQ